MVSLDVVSLFTGVATEEALTVVHHKLAVDPSLEEHSCIRTDDLEMLTFGMGVWRILKRRLTG